MGHYNAGAPPADVPNTPAGIQFVPGAGANTAAADVSRVVPLFANTDGDPDRVVVFSTLSTTAVALVEYKRLGESWVFDPDDCAFDTSITLTDTSDAQGHIVAFAIDSPAGTGDRVLFVTYSNASESPDELIFDTIVLTPGASSLATVAGVVAGINGPTATDNITVVSAALTTSRVMTIFQDDAHFGDITESTGTYTITYTDAKVSAIDTAIVSSESYSMFTIGAQTLLVEGATNIGFGPAAWELTAAAVLTQAFDPFGAVGNPSNSAVGNGTVVGVTGIGGVFAYASAAGQAVAATPDWFVIATFPIDDV